jgi:bifunctional DNA-binding transcriptional regulator/antitoxin component of YhaV-PrlF toxin-antitoxin module
MLAKKTSKNQITLPKAISAAFPDAEYFDVSIEENRILLRPVKMVPYRKTLEEVRAKMAKLGIAENDVSEAVTWARRKRA